jgi:hypothetical protein
MAGRGISIDILANVRDALRGAGDVERALSDIESTLDDMARSGDSSTDKMSRGFRDLSRDADTSADKIERSYKQAYRDTSRAADSAADDARRAQRRMGEQSEEVGQEIRQNLGEGIANAARGDFESLADVIGDTLGGAVAGIGGIGTVAAAAAGAAGLGLITAGIYAQVEAAEKLRQRLSDAYRQAIDEGRDYINEAQVMAELQDLMFNEDRAGEYNRLLEDQVKLGLDIETLAGANIGRQEDLAEIQDRINVLKERGSEISRGEDSILGDIDTQLAGIENRWVTAQQETENQANKVRELEAAEKRLGEEARAQADKTAAVSQARYEAMAERYRNPITVKLDLDTSAADRKLAALRSAASRGIVAPVGKAPWGVALE